MEKIIEIKEYENNEVSGFKILTTKQSIELFIDNNQQCCENWGYFWCNDDIRDFVGSELLSIRLTDAALNEVQLKNNGVNPNSRYFEGRIMFVNFETNKGTLQFVAYNEHNGYYGHNAGVKCDQLTHSEVL